MVSPSKATSLAIGTVGGGGTKVDAGAIAAPFRVEVREKVEALKAKGIGEHKQQKSGTRYVLMCCVALAFLNCWSSHSFIRLR